MQRIVTSKIFWIFLVIGTAFVFPLSLGMDKSYKAESRIIILPKSQELKNQSEQMVKNALFFLKTISFYDKISEKGQFFDTSSDSSFPARKKYWEEKVKIERIPNSGIIRIVTFDADQSRAELLNQEITNEEIATLSRYYDIKNEIDVRVLDAPISELQNLYVSQNKFVVGLTSILAGFALGLAAFLAHDFLRVFIFKKEKPFPISLPDILKKPVEMSEDLALSFGKKVEWPKKEKITEKSPSEIRADSQKEAAKPTFSSVVIPTFKKGSAPENLPSVSMEDLDSIFKTVPVEDEDKKEKTFVEEHKSAFDTPEEKSEKKEPTPEEVKERLNQLLSGKF